MRWSSLCEKVHTVWTLTEHKSSHHFFGDIIRFGRCEFWKIHVLLRPSLMSLWLPRQQLSSYGPEVHIEVSRCPHQSKVQYVW